MESTADSHSDGRNRSAARRRESACAKAATPTSWGRSLRKVSRAYTWAPSSAEAPAPKADKADKADKAEKAEKKPAKAKKPKASDE